MKYWVDFSSWLIEGKDENDVYAKVRELIEGGAKKDKIPTVSSIQEAEEDEENELSEMIELE